MSTSKHTRGEISGRAGGHRHLPQSPAAHLRLYLHCDLVNDLLSALLDKFSKKCNVEQKHIMAGV